MHKQCVWPNKLGFYMSCVRLVKTNFAQIPAKPQWWLKMYLGLEFSSRLVVSVSRSRRHTVENVGLWQLVLEPHSLCLVRQDCQEKNPRVGFRHHKCVKSVNIDTKIVFSKSKSTAG